MLLQPPADPPQPADSPKGPEPAAVQAWMARRSVPAQWRPFLAALAESLGNALGAEMRNDVLRRTGARLAELQPLPPSTTLAELEGRVNDALAAMDWGHAAFFLDGTNRALVIRHWAAPLVATPGQALGEWIVPVLEGLHGGWLAGQAQPGQPPRLRGATHEPGCVTLRST